LTVKGEGPPRDPVSVSADDGAEVGVAREISVEIIEAEHDIGISVVSVGDIQRGDDAAVGRDRHLRTGIVGEQVELDRSTVGQCAEWLFRDAGDWCVRTHREYRRDDSCFGVR
jgi:hypothetical protein